MRSSEDKLFVNSSRRKFLQRSGMALAGAALAPDVIMAQADKERGMDKKVRIGVVGGGFGAAFHWHRDPNCIVEAVSDLRADRRKRLQDVYKCDKPYPSLEELIKDKKVDAVAVFTGAPDHVRHCVACMKAGKHVISAVPACMSIEEADELLETQQKTGLTYMMAETSYYHPVMMSACKMHKEGKFGDIYYTEAEYHHAGMEYSLWKDAQGKHTWRWGYPPMLYPTHCTSFLIGVTGERLVEATCIGWGDGDPIMEGNTYGNNKFWNETALFKTDRGHAFRVSINWRGAFGGVERAQWYGSKMSLFEPHPNGVGPVIRRATDKFVKDGAGYDVGLAAFEKYEPPKWIDELPEPMRIGGGHEGAEPFLTHEFIDALINERKPAVDIHEALAYTVPGIIAHKSALEHGKQMKVPSFDR